MVHKYFTIRKAATMSKDEIRKYLNIINESSIKGIKPLTESSGSEATLFSAVVEYGRRKRYEGDGGWDTSSETLQGKQGDMPWGESYEIPTTPIGNSFLFAVAPFGDGCLYAYDVGEGPKVMEFAWDHIAREPGDIIYSDDKEDSEIFDYIHDKMGLRTEEDQLTGVAILVDVKFVIAHFDHSVAKKKLLGILIGLFGKGNLQVVGFICKKLREHGCVWPELDAIERQLRIA